MQRFDQLNKNDEISVSIIIPTYNEAENIGTTLNMIVRQKQTLCFNNRMVSINPEIIVLDSGSTDGTIDIVRAFQSTHNFVRLVTLKRFHHSLVRNLGGKIARGVFLVFLNADAIPANEYWLINLIKPMIMGICDAVFSRQIPRKKLFHFESAKVLAVYSRTSVLIDKNNYIRFYGKHGILFSTVSCAIKRSIFERLGGFSKNVRINEDQEFAIRLLKQGFRIFYSAKSIVYHSHFEGLRKLFWRYFRFGYGWRTIRNLHRDFKLKHNSASMMYRTLKYLLSIHDLANKNEDRSPLYIISQLITPIIVTLAFLVGFNA